MQVHSLCYSRLEYKKNRWTISDGDGNKPSTNGIWLFVEDPTKIHDGAVFKAGQLSFKVKITDLK